MRKNHLQAFCRSVEGGCLAAVLGRLYDGLCRLTSAETSVWSLSWVYDRYGNRLSQTATGVQAYGLSQRDSAKRIPRDEEVFNQVH